MIPENYIAALRADIACKPAMNWLLAEDRTVESAWCDCQRGDHLLWVANFVAVGRTLVVLAGCDCAELALVYVPDGENRPRLAIETARRHVKGEATDDEMATAEAAAWEAAWEAPEAATRAAARAAARAQTATAAWAAAREAARAAEAAAKPAAAMHAKCADAVRTRIPWSIFEAAIKAKFGDAK